MNVRRLYRFLNNNETPRSLPHFRYFIFSISATEITLAQAAACTEKTFIVKARKERGKRMKRQVHHSLGLKLFKFRNRILRNCMRQNTASRRTTSAQGCIYAYQCLTLCMCICIHRVYLEVGSEYSSEALNHYHSWDDRFLSFPLHPSQSMKQTNEIIHDLRQYSI